MSSKLVIFDFEVFRYDTLLGVTIIDDKERKRVQTWDLKEMIRLYEDNLESIWIGHNNAGYDNFILQGVVNGLDEQKIKALSDKLVHEDNRFHRLNMQLHYYDLMSNHWTSLKTLEAYFGKNISETEVDFNLNRPLTDEEKRRTESYNGDDLDQTETDFFYQLAEFNLRLDVIKEFNLPMSCLNVTGTRLAEEVLHARKVPGIETWVKLPKMYDNLRVKNQQVIDFYMNRKYAAGEKLYATFCGTEHTIAAGGIHGAKRKYYCKEAWYFDVSGYYNLIMILLDLLPRSIPDEYKKLYEHMYHEQLRLKKIDPGKRGVYKTILLSVFGAMNNEHCRFYDPYNGDLVRMSGQMYLVDLLEKLEGKVEVVQSNTDGIIAKLIGDTTEDDLKEIVNEWQTRTGFVLKLEKVYDIYQRDVNCYLYKDANGEIHTLGEAVKDYGKWQWPFWKESYNSKEPIIMCECIVQYLMFNKKPEDVIKENMRNLRMFQYICKKLSFDWVEYEVVEIATGNTEVVKVQNVNRAFALKSTTHRGMVYKYKNSTNRQGNNVLKKTKVSNLPDSVFVYNDEIISDEAVDYLIDVIDYDYYVKRAYERIEEFIDIPQIGDIYL